MATAQFALVGAPNCGKTVLFNGLTGANAKVANYAGVTVDKRSGSLKGEPNIKIIDLPGTYSLHTTSPNEEVTRCGARQTRQTPRRNHRRGRRHQFTHDAAHDFGTETAQLAHGCVAEHD